MSLLRTGFDAYVKLIRLPFDQAAKLLGRKEDPETKIAEGERARAEQLREEAQRTKARADQKAAQRKRQAAVTERRHDYPAQRAPADRRATRPSG